jgi:hypothetical protein
MGSTIRSAVGAVTAPPVSVSVGGVAVPPVLLP